MIDVFEHFEAGPFYGRIDNLICEDDQLRIQIQLSDHTMFDMTHKMTLEAAKDYVLCWCKEEVRRWQIELDTKGLTI